MGLRTKIFKVDPWIGGINTSVDPAEIGPNEVIRADNVTYDTRGSKQKRDGINFNWDLQTDDTQAMLSLREFWFGTAAGKTQRLVALSSLKEVYSFNPDGTRSADLFGGTAWASAITTGTQATFTNLQIICADGTGNVVKKWTGTGNIADLGGTPPKAAICNTHLSRLWLNDETNVDRLHFSPTQDAETWNGTGDSGAIDIGIGDGDPDGITAFAPYKGDLIVFKRTKIYRIIGPFPETFQVIKISDSIGCVGPNALADVDGEDLVFVSDRGVHSLVTTDTFGDVAKGFLSRDIQGSFNKSFNKSRLKFLQARYLPTTNSVGLALTDGELSPSENLMIWWFHIELKQWYRWRDLSCQSMAIANDADRVRLYLGTNTKRVAKAFNGTLSDIDSSGSNAGIDYTAKTGLIDVEGNAFILKGFKTFGILYKANGTHTITVKVKVDNLPEQTLTFVNTDDSDLLGSTFILGTSILGFNSTMALYMRSICGYGKFVQITITQTGEQEEVDIQGFFLEYEASGVQREVVNANA